MSAQIGLTIGLTIAAGTAFGGWRMLVPRTDSGSSGVSNQRSPRSSRRRSRRGSPAAQASLDAQRSATGSHAGAVVRPPLTLVRADSMLHRLHRRRAAPRSSIWWGPA